MTRRLIAKSSSGRLWRPPRRVARGRQCNRRGADGAEEDAEKSQRRGNDRLPVLLPLAIPFLLCGCLRGLRASAVALPPGRSDELTPRVSDRAGNPAVLTGSAPSATIQPTPRRSGRAAECAGLENR